MTNERVRWWRRRLSRDEGLILLGALWLFLAALFGFTGAMSPYVLVPFAIVAAVLIVVGIYRRRRRP